MASRPSFFRAFRKKSDPTIEIDEHEGLEEGQTFNGVARPEEDARALSPSTLPVRPKLNSVSSSTSTLNPAHFGKSAAPGSHLDNELGLHLVVDHPSPTGDIIFVHGLGGSPWKTWSWNRDTNNFWPSWLADEDLLSTWRIFTFGYDSNWRGAGANLNISDFAKDLLFQMLTFPMESRPFIGDRKIIFVAHSMGGLVVKKAYIYGKQDSQFSGIVSMFHGIVFLGTPHRGSQSATTLNNILSLPFAPSQKSYVADLQTNGNALHEINEQFRHHCHDLELVSFFETQKTTLGPQKAMIVEKDSAVLQLPGEISSSLPGDHHSICKFQSRTDPPYINVKGSIGLMARRSAPDEEVQATPGSEEQIATILGIHDAIREDFNTVRSRVMDGTCRWLIKRPDFHDWANCANSLQSTGPQIFWLTGLPATGKSSLSSAVIDYIESTYKNCQYHFFSNGHQTKRTVAYCLRSIASQLARTNSLFREALFAFHAETGNRFTSQDSNFQNIWEKIFEGIIFKMAFDQPLFWVIDGVDEGDFPSEFTSLIGKIRSLTTIRIFLSSRMMNVPMKQATNSCSITTLPLSENHTETDIRSYVATTIQDILPVDQITQQDLINQVLSKASGSFLWARLSLEALRENWHTEDDIRKALNDLPTGMLALYGRMVEKLRSQPENTLNLAKKILTWITCSWRPISVQELKIALEPEVTGFLNLEDTVNQICGHFVSIDNGRICLIHTTARQFLTTSQGDQPPFIETRTAHSQMAIRCLAYLSQDHWPRVFRKFSSNATNAGGKGRKNRLVLAEHGFPLLGYATCYWAYHVSKSPTFSGVLASKLKDFFSQYCLPWIEAIALSANLRYLTRSAKYLKAYAKRRKHAKAHKDSSPVLESLTKSPEDDPMWLQSWAIDLIRVVGKFGSILLSRPSSIYRDITPFCPRNSMMALTYGEHNSVQLTVTGLSTEGWDDRLASVSVGDEYTASKVLATEAYFITLVSYVGIITIWYAETCEQARKIELKEYTPIMALNQKGTLLATASYSRYAVWELSSGRLVAEIKKTTEMRTITMSFEDDDNRFLVGCDDCSITTYDRIKLVEVARYIFEAPSPDYIGCPSAMSISPDCTTVAIAWRGKTPLVWHFISTPFQPVQMRKPRRQITSLLGPDKLRWQTDGGSVFVLCQDNNLVEWRLFDDHQMIHTHLKAREFSISRDGTLILTSDTDGTLSVWAFPRLSLVYQLKSENDPVKGIEFSPDSQRLYDVRNSMCSIWEPDVLIRPDDQDMEDHSSLDDVSFVSSEPALAQVDKSSGAVTAIAINSTDNYYCCGRDDGTVRIHEATNGSPIQRVYDHAPDSSVLQLKWSSPGKYIVSSDDSARIITKRLEVKAQNKWGIYPVLDIRVSEPVQQFLFDPDERFLLVSTSSSDQVYNLRLKKKLIWSKQWDTKQSRRWVQHPFIPASLVWIDSRTVTCYEWSKMSVLSSVEINSTTHAQPKEIPSSHSYVQSENTVLWATCIGSSGQLLYGTLPKKQSQGSVSCLSHSGLHLESIQLSKEPDSFVPFPIPNCIPELAKQVKRLVGTIENQVVFLDHDHQLCTWDLGMGSDGLRRHFFLPRDWLDASSLELAVAHEHGTFYFPRGVHVAIVRNGIQV